MLVLVILACLGEVCEEKRLVTYEHQLTPFQCMMTSQPVLAQWNNEHPKHTIKKYKCVRASELGEET